MKMRWKKLIAILSVIALVTSSDNVLLINANEASISEEVNDNESTTVSMDEADEEINDEEDIEEDIEEDDVEDKLSDDTTAAETDTVETENRDENENSEFETTAGEHEEGYEPDAENNDQETAVPSYDKNVVGLNVTYHTQEEIQDFVNNYPASLTQSVTYKDEPSLKEPYSPGVLSDKTVNSALNMLNQVRYIAGLNANVTNDEEKAEKVSAGTLLNYLNGALSHTPERPKQLTGSKYDELYDKGYEGTSKANIAMGYTTINNAIINGWCADDDAGNIARIGHRRWLLSPALTSVGFGMTGRYSAVYVSHNYWESSQTYVAWPAQEMPVQYFSNDYPWSVTVYDLYWNHIGENVSVTLTREKDGKTWNFSTNGSSNGDFYTNAEGYGSNYAIIFRPKGISISAGDVYDVSIDMSDGQGSSTALEYKVHFFNLDTSVSEPVAVKSVELQPSSLVLSAGETSKLTYTVKPNNAKDKSVNFSSSNEEVATVDSEGVVTAIKSGTAVITVTTNDGGHKASCNVNVRYVLGNDTGVTLKQNTFTYNGINHQPKVVVTVGDTVLTESQDYELTYSNNRNAGTAQVIITGIGYYEGSITKDFEISPANLTIKAKDVRLELGDAIPQKYDYDITGLAAGDTLIEEPTLSCDIQSTDVKGIYDIVPGNAKADANYNSNIKYINGTLTVSDERVSYTVTFDVQGINVTFAPDKYIGINAGQTIERPENPTAEGYIFAGWYQDSACTKVWDFENDIVQGDITLYAKWLLESSDTQTGIRIHNIADVHYTGSAQKPIFSVYDGDLLLKSNKDYKVTYYNNINANAVDSNGERKYKKGSGIGEDFDEFLPYAVITGKGNYNESIKINFNILPAAIGDSNENPSDGIKLSYTDQTTINVSKEFKPFKSIKYKKAMKIGTDYEVILKTANAYDDEGKRVEAEKILDNNAVPKGYQGSFSLTVIGKGNYEGSITTTISVSDKNHLLKNAKITIGKNLKSIKYEGKYVRLTSAYYDSTNKTYYKVINGEVTSEEIAAADAFTVKCGNEQLIYQRDFDVTYIDNSKVGTAVLVIRGKGEYAGTKTATFKIIGEAFNAKNITIEGISDKTYTGKAITQNKAVLTYAKGTSQARQLVYGEDYTISYKKNINKGTSTITFTAADGSIFSGKFNKSFKIMPADINTSIKDESMQNISVKYQKSGAAPSDAVLLSNEAGIELKNGRDYSVSYRNNKSVANASDAQCPTIIIKGKGNYSGTMEVPFTITKAELSEAVVSIKPVAYDSKKAKDYIYKLTVKLTDKKSPLKEKIDYSVEYINNTQSAYETYIEKLEDGTATISDRPIARITAIAESNYTSQESIEVELPIYKNKLAKNNVYVVIGEAGYTGAQVTPDVKVYYSNDKKIISQAKGITDEETLISMGLVKLKDTDYTLSYKANIVAGKNKGSVTISGAGPYYGGDVTMKFTIDSKAIAW
ncbi:MAG: InlB B-repeat-containing protein [Lachnospiraceae bacterium]|nr:InlB B-repeat-containing protein [Lachnospiraceae bacterium]